MKDSLRSGLFLFRRATAGYRALPDYIVVGAQKSGTTSLFFYLIQHPRIRKPFRSEIHFFDGGTNPADDRFSKGVAWYRANFPVRRGSFITGDVTPRYLLDPDAPKRISDLLPDVKIVALLRNPVDRAISHYFHETRKGRESLPLLAAMKQEEERLKPVLEKKEYRNPLFRNCSYKTRGMYAEQLRRFFAFFPREQVFVTSSEDFFGDPRCVLRELFLFLNVDPTVEIGNLAPQNIGRNRTGVSEDVYSYLHDYFAAPNQELFELLGRTFPWDSWSNE